MLGDKGISAIQVVPILTVLVSLPMFFFLGQLGLNFIAMAVVVIAAVGAMLARSRRPS